FHGIGGHASAPSRYKTTPAPQHAASVGIIPTLKRKIAMAAASESASAHGSTLAGTGASNAIGNACTGTVARNTVWSANQHARLSMRPTTAGVMDDGAELSALLSRSVSMKGAPRKIQRKHGVNVTQVASRPPSVPASIGDNPPGSRNAAMKPTNCSTMISGPGVVSAMPR